MPPLFSGNGRHRRPRQAPSFVVTAGVTGAGIAIPLLGATGASAADTSTWDTVAECESGGLWSADGDNGFYGGLQLDQETWEEFGGTEYADRADLASRGQQIAVAEKILQEKGTEEWPDCAESAGLSADSTESPDVVVPDGSDETAEPVPERPYPSSPSGTAPEDDGSASESPSGEPSGTDGSTDPGGSGSSDGSGEPTDPPESADPPEPTDPPESADPSESAEPSSPNWSDDGNYLFEPAYPAAPDEGGHADSGGSDDSGESAGSGEGAGDYRGDPDEHPSREGSDERTDTDTGSGGGDHRVAGGESLSDIAEENGVRGGWQELYERNRDVIGSDPDLIVPGQELRL